MPPLPGPSGMWGSLWGGTHSTSSSVHWKEHNSTGLLLVLSFWGTEWLDEGSSNKRELSVQ